MTESEAIEFVKAFLECRDKEHAVDFNYQYDRDCESCELNYSQGTIGQQTESMEIAIMALEKQIPRHPDYEGDGYYNCEIVYDTWICPCCKKRYEVDYDDYDYCPSCGQKLDWSDMNETD